MDAPNDNRHRGTDRVLIRSAAPFGQKHKWSLWPSELLLPILSTLNSHLFTEKKIQDSTHNWPSQLPKFADCIEKSKNRNLHRPQPPLHHNSHGSFVFPPASAMAKSMARRCKGAGFWTTGGLGEVSFIWCPPNHPKPDVCWWLGLGARISFDWNQGGTAFFLVHFSARMSRVGVGWGGTVTFITLRSWHDALGFSFRHSWGWGRSGGAITSFGTCTHVMLPLMSTCSIGLTSPMCLSRDVLRYVMGFALVSLMLTCTRGLKSPMCFARDVLCCIIGFGVVRFMLTCILDGDGWRSRF